MTRPGRWELFGYGLWALGCVFFAIVAVRDGDELSLVASGLFLVGIVAVVIPHLRSR